MERLGVTQPLMIVFKVNKFKQLELREFVFVVGKRSALVLTALLVFTLAAFFNFLVTNMTYFNESEH